MLLRLKRQKYMSENNSRMKRVLRVKHSDNWQGKYVIIEYFSPFKDDWVHCLGSSILERLFIVKQNEAKEVFKN